MTKRKPPHAHKKRGRKPAVGAMQIKLDARRLEALKLREAGYHYRDIGEWLDPPVKATRAYEIVMEALANMTTEIRETAEHVRQMELMRLDTMMIEPYAAACQGDLRAIDVVLKIMERRAKILGLDAPKKQEHAGANGGAIPFTQVERVVIDVVYPGSYNPGSRLLGMQT